MLLRCLLCVGVLTILSEGEPSPENEKDVSVEFSSSLNCQSGTTSVDIREEEPQGSSQVSPYVGEIESVETKDPVSGVYTTLTEDEIKSDSNTPDIRVTSEDGNLIVIGISKDYSDTSTTSQEFSNSLNNLQFSSGSSSFSEVTKQSANNVRNVVGSTGSNTVTYSSVFVIPSSDSNLVNYVNAVNGATLSSQTVAPVSYSIEFYWGTTWYRYNYIWRPWWRCRWGWPFGWISWFRWYCPCWCYRPIWYYYGPYTWSWYWYWNNYYFPYWWGCPYWGTPYWRYCYWRPCYWYWFRPFWIW